MKIPTILSILALMLGAVALAFSQSSQTPRAPRTDGSWTIYAVSRHVREPWIFLYNKKTGVVYRYVQTDKAVGFVQLHPPTDELLSVINKFNK